MSDEDEDEAMAALRAACDEIAAIPMTGLGEVQIGIAVAVLRMCTQAGQAGGRASASRTFHASADIDITDLVDAAAELLHVVRDRGFDDRGLGHD